MLILASTVTDMLLWGGVFGLALVGLGVAVIVLRRKLLPTEGASRGQAPSPFSVEGLEAMRAAGRISEEEFRRLRRAALSVLERLMGADNPELWPLAASLLDDPDPETRLPAILLLVRCGDFFYLADAVSALNELLSQQSHPDHRSAGLRILQTMGDARLVRNLARYLHDPDDGVVRRELTAPHVQPEVAGKHEHERSVGFAPLVDVAGPHLDVQRADHLGQQRLFVGLELGWSRRRESHQQRGKRQPHVRPELP